MRTSTEIRKLPVLLDADQMMVVVEQLMNVLQRQGEEAQRWARVKAEHKEVEEALQEEHVTILGVLQSRQQDRDVACQITYDDEAGKVIVFRMDTAEVVEERDMTSDDRQELIAFAGNNESSPAPSATFNFDVDEAVAAAGKQWWRNASAVVLIGGGKHKSDVAWHMGHVAAALRKQATLNPFVADTQSEDGVLHTRWSEGHEAFGALAGD